MCVCAVMSVGLLVLHRRTPAPSYLHAALHADILFIPLMSTAAFNNDPAFEPYYEWHCWLINEWISKFEFLCCSQRHGTLLSSKLPHLALADILTTSRYVLGTYEALL